MLEGFFYTTSNGDFEIFTEVSPQKRLNENLLYIIDIIVVCGDGTQQTFRGAIFTQTRRLLLILNELRKNFEESLRIFSDFE